MKIRISENKLRELILRSITEAKIPLTDRKQVNNVRKIGTYEAESDIIPSFVVVVSNFQDPTLFEDFKNMAEDRICNSLGGDAPVDNGEYGISLFADLLNGRIQQVFGIQTFADSTLTTQGEDPINFTYGPGRPKCPYEYQDSYVIPKEGTEELLANFQRYTREDGLNMAWTFATCHGDKVIFFFTDLYERNTFSLAIRNMCWIARHTQGDKNRGGGFKYTFSFKDNPQCLIEEHANVDPKDFLDPQEDSDIIAVIDDIIEHAQSDAAQSSVEGGEDIAQQQPNVNGAEIDQAQPAVQPAAEPSIAPEEPVDNPEDEDKFKLTEAKLQRYITESIMRHLKL